MIVLFGDYDDPHLNKIKSHLDERGESCEIFGTDESSLLETEVSWRGESTSLFQKNKEIILKEVSVSFIISPIFRKEGNTNQIRDFWHASWKESLYGIYDLISLSSRSVNKNLYNAIGCQSKFKLGFLAGNLNIPHPKYIITNKKEEIDSFFSYDFRVVLKTLHQMNLEKDNEPVMFLSKIVEQKDFDDFSSDNEPPIYLQEYIEKDYDARVVVIGKKLIGCKIDASKSKYGNVDWRAYDLPKTIHEKIDIPSEVAKDTIKLMGVMELDYACIDFCIDSNGKWWLLDVNPFGKYMWMEMAVNLETSSSIASYLSENKN